MTPITSIALLPSPSSPPQQKRKRPGTCPAVPEVGSAKATTRWNWEQTLRVFIFFLLFWFSFAQGGAECCGGEYLAYQLRHITLLGFWSYFQPLKGEEGFLAHSNFPLFKRAGPRPSWQFCFPTSLHPGVHSSKRIPPPSPPPARPPQSRHREGVARRSPASCRAHASGPQNPPPGTRSCAGQSTGSSAQRLERSGPSENGRGRVRAGERAPPWQLGPPAPAPVLRNPGARRQPTEPRRFPGSPTCARPERGPADGWGGRERAGCGRCREREEGVADSRRPHPFLMALPESLV